MRSLIIYANKSLTITDEIPDGNIEDETLLVGSNDFNYASYLFFDLSVLPDNITNLKAQLVLFKTGDFNNSPIKFSIYPLAEHFSSFTTYNNYPSWNKNTRVDFLPFTKSIAAESNMTSIVSSWYNGTLLNRGILIIANTRNAALASFGSAYNTNNDLIPLLHISFEETQASYNYTNINYPASANVPAQAPASVASNASASANTPTWIPAAASTSTPISTSFVVPANDITTEIDYPTQG